MRLDVVSALMDVLRHMVAHMGEPIDKPLIDKIFSIIIAGTKPGLG